MKRSHKHFWTEAALWLMAEIFLNLAGLDTLADYSEFLLSQRICSNSSQLLTNNLVDSNGQSDHGCPIGLHLAVSPPLIGLTPS